MAGLLGDVLPAVFSAGDRAKRYLGGLLSDPMGRIEQTLGQASDNVRQLGLLSQQAYGDKRDPMKVTNPQAAKQYNDAMFNMVSSFAPAGITVWHGSPHKFDPEPGYPLGRFRAEKIGTGEGKQQQGIGAYLAEAQAVGQKYADKEAWKRGMDSGYLYKVDIPDDMVAKMANYEMPFSQQPENVKKAVQAMIGPDELAALRGYHGWERIENAPFAAVMDAMETVRGNNRVATSTALRDAGIPGIRYLDGGSRGTGGGTSNFVVFPGNEGLLSILERNGQPLK